MTLRNDSQKWPNCNFKMAKLQFKNGKIAISKLQFRMKFNFIHNCNNYNCNSAIFQCHSEWHFKNLHSIIAIGNCIKCSISTHLNCNEINRRQRCRCHPRWAHRFRGVHLQGLQTVLEVQVLPSLRYVRCISQVLSVETSQPRRLFPSKPICFSKPPPYNRGD